MKFLKKMKDGGPESPVDGFFLVEIKSLFSVVLLRFNDGQREAYHSHAFDAFTWFLRGDLIEEDIDGTEYVYRKSLIPKLTKKEKCHRVRSVGPSWCLSLRGPWTKNWFEVSDDKKTKTVLTHGRKIEEVITSI